MKKLFTLERKIATIRWITPNRHRKLAIAKAARAEPGNFVGRPVNLYSTGLPSQH